MRAVLVTLLLYPALWGPFEPGTEPRALAVRRIEAAMDGPRASFRFAGSVVGIEQVSGEDPYVVVDLDGKTVSRVARGYQLAREAFVADFNEDGKDDLALFLPSGGNGLAADIHWLVLLLSAKDRYVSHTLLTMAPSQNDFVIVKGRPAIIRTSFVYGERGRDGREHNYWVYETLRIRGTKIATIGQRKWVMFTFGENHRATTQLTPAQKRRLWNRSSDAHGTGRIQ